MGDGKRVKHVKVKITQLYPTLCDPMDYTVHGILQVRILEWVAFPFSRGSSQPRDTTQVSHTAARLFTYHEPGNMLKHVSSVQFSSVTQSCPTLCDSMDCITPGFPVHHQLLELRIPQMLGIIINTCVTCQGLQKTLEKQKWDKEALSSRRGRK